jgi:uncharacterized membrane protein YfcA
VVIFDLPFLVFIYLLIVYFLGGITQGLLGVGLITVVISLLSFVLDVKQTIALVLVPTLVTGFYQMIQGENFKNILSEVKYFLIFSSLIIIPGIFFLKILDSSIILFFIALILFLNSSLTLLNKIILIPHYQNPGVQATLGTINGFIIGVTSIYTMPFVFLLQSLQYPKEKAVQFMGLAFVFYSAVQIITFFSIGLINVSTLVPSLVVTLPVMIGFLIGKKIRGIISENIFRKLFHCMLILMSLIILANLVL